MNPLHYLEQFYGSTESNIPLESPFYVLFHLILSLQPFQNQIQQTQSLVFGPFVYQMAIPLSLPINTFHNTYKYSTYTKEYL